MRPVGRFSRWAWGLCGLVTAVAVAVPVSRLIFSAGDNPALATAQLRQHELELQQKHWFSTQQKTMTITVPQQVTSLNVQDYAGLLVVAEAHVKHVQVTEQMEFAYHASPPKMVQSVSGGRLSLADPACADWTCSVSFSVTVPPGVTVTAAGGPMSISGTSGANLDSDGEPVTATNIHGPLTVSTHGGPLEINGLTGPLSASTAGGQVVATHITAATAVVTTGAGEAYIAFSAAPESVTVSTAGRRAKLTVPGGPYALSTNGSGTSQIMDITTSSTASHSITVNTAGGPLAITSPETSGTLPRQPSPLPAGTGVGMILNERTANSRPEFAMLGPQWDQLVEWGQLPPPGRVCDGNFAYWATFSRDSSDQEPGFREPRWQWHCRVDPETRRSRGPGVLDVLRQLFWMS